MTQFKVQMPTSLLEREALQARLESLGLVVQPDGKIDEGSAAGVRSSSGRSGIAALQEIAPDGVITADRAAGLTGQRFLESIRGRAPAISEQQTAALRSITMAIAGLRNALSSPSTKPEALEARTQPLLRDLSRLLHGGVQLERVDPTAVRALAAELPGLTEAAAAHARKLSAERLARMRDAPNELLVQAAADLRAANNRLAVIASVAGWLTDAGAERLVDAAEKAAAAAKGSRTNGTAADVLPSLHASAVLQSAGASEVSLPKLEWKRHQSSSSQVQRAHLAIERLESFAQGTTTSIRDLNVARSNNNWSQAERLRSYWAGGFAPQGHETPIGALAREALVDLVRSEAELVSRYTRALDTDLNRGDEVGLAGLMAAIANVSDLVVLSRGVHLEGSGDRLAVSRVEPRLETAGPLAEVLGAILDRTSLITSSLSERYIWPESYQGALHQTVNPHALDCRNWPETTRVYEGLLDVIRGMSNEVRLPPELAKKARQIEADLSTFIERGKDPSKVPARPRRVVTSADLGYTEGLRQNIRGALQHHNAFGALGELNYMLSRSFLTIRGPIEVGPAAPELEKTIHDVLTPLEKLVASAAGTDGVSKGLSDLPLALRSRLLGPDVTLSPELTARVQNLHDAALKANEGSLGANLAKVNAHLTSSPPQVDEALRQLRALLPYGEKNPLTRADLRDTVAAAVKAALARAGDIALTGKLYDASASLTDLEMVVASIDSKPIAADLETALGSLVDRMTGKVSADIVDARRGSNPEIAREAVHVAEQIQSWAESPWVPSADNESWNKTAKRAGSLRQQIDRAFHSSLELSSFLAELQRIAASAPPASPARARIGAWASDISGIVKNGVEAGRVLSQPWLTSER